MLHAALTHRTCYHYDRTIGIGPQIIRLRPAPHCRTPILSYSLSIEPQNHWINWQQDPFGNFLARVIVPEKANKLSVTVDLVADMAVINPFEFYVDEASVEWPFKYAEWVKKELHPYLAIDPVGQGLQHYFDGIDKSKQVTLDFVCDLNRNLQKRVAYIVRMEPGVQSPEETLQKCSGSCRDSAWLLVQILRNLGLAARFVSGYLIQLKPDVKPLEGPAGTDVDFCDLHAWAEVYLPGAGWVGLDPTSGLLAGESHIPLAATPHPISAAPIVGGHEKAEVDFVFDMSVTRIRETPRVTLPYSEETWKDIRESGDVIDQRLIDLDVRLSMGGEPTFVAVDDMDGAEWTISAVGPNKRRYAEKLARRLHKRFAPGGLLHFGQGKWYPGEPLPRWALGIYWRTDGQPLWEDISLIAAEPPDGVTAGLDVAEDFAELLCVELGLHRESAMPAYEDAAHYMLVEQKLPVNLSLAECQLEGEAERARLIGVFDRGLSQPAAYVLPIKAWQTGDGGRRWITEHWALRREKLFLVPGDSPAGLRLPLGSLAHLEPTAHPHVRPRDPFSDMPALPPRDMLTQRRRTATLEAPAAPQSGPSDIYGSVRTALTVEPRDGRLCVFMPPLEDAEDYAALTAAIEETARNLKTPVALEGYTPGFDSRIKEIKVTPDPGVIEVNVQPATSWDEAIEITTGLYEGAHQSWLGTEKFMLDGRHTGTGGGNHIVLGGVTPADSPFLRRPDLLASLIAYWQNHPSLSYLFSGLFIGPTSQAPRVDEARHESIYELEIALRQVPSPDVGSLPPWLVDRLFRNLLVDVTGNTHRAEICIDKLYSPDGSSGRLGLIEFRSFEMPPHPHMSLAQQLLLRALIAQFWQQPYRAKLLRWGTALHDRFMLPQFVWQDFADVVTDLQKFGLPMKLEWFEPHFEFRFPRFGRIENAGLEVELRQALEPWHVMGEEDAAGATARYVDSSLERVQVKINGQMGERYVLTCNGHRLPLSPTGISGCAVAGVRYRASQPPSSLHPTIAPHVPLRFDIYDHWTGRSLGGCRYHVAHPGGRNLEVFPINAFEAEGRRLARFEAMGHSPGSMIPGPQEKNADYPMTLDLRYFD